MDNGVTFLATQKFNELDPKTRQGILADESHPTSIAVFGHLSGNKKTDAINNAKKVADAQKLQQDVISGVQTTMAVVDGIGTVGRALGWDFVESEEFQEGTKYLNAAGGLVMSYFSGNPTMAINAVTSLFAGPVSYTHLTLPTKA